MKAPHPHIILLMCCIFFTGPQAELRGRIRSKVDKDGTLIYYNEEYYKNGRTAGKISPARLKSPYDKLIEKYSRRSDIDPTLIKCIIKVESDFNPDAVSVAGAMGLMQLMQSTASIYGVKDPLDPEENIRAGTKHFKSLMNYFNNDISLALAAYHAGLGRVKKRMKIPPITSTINYVNAVMSLYRGDCDYSGDVKKLYRRIDKEGDIIIYSR